MSVFATALTSSCQYVVTPSTVVISDLVSNSLADDGKVFSGSSPVLFGASFNVSGFVTSGYSIYSIVSVSCTPSVGTKPTFFGSRVYMSNSGIVTHRGVPVTFAQDLVVNVVEAGSTGTINSSFVVRFTDSVSRLRVKVS